MKRKILLIILLLSLKIDAMALTYGGCEYSAISRIKSLVSNINISYDYHIVDNTAYFDITLNNIPQDIYFMDTDTNIKYTYSDTNNGEITVYDHTKSSGSFKFYSTLDKCYGISVGTKYYTLPIYNKYFKDEACLDIPEFSLCQKWSSINYTYDEFKKLVDEYKKKKNDSEENEDIPEYNKTIIDKAIDFYISYYYFILVGIILICIPIMLIKNRKDRFDL